MGRGGRTLSVVGAHGEVWCLTPQFNFGHKTGEGKFEALQGVLVLAPSTVIGDWVCGCRCVSTSSRVLRSPRILLILSDPEKKNRVEGEG